MVCKRAEVTGKLEYPRHRGVLASSQWEWDWDWQIQLYLSELEVFSPEKLQSHFQYLKRRERDSCMGR